MQVLVLGCGWVGSRLCLQRDPSRFIATTRSVEKLSELTAVGINAVQFDLQVEETWSNLPPKSDIEATVITFELLGTQLPQLSRLWDTYVATDRPIICLGTSSCFQSGGYDSIVDETAPLTGKSVTGKSLLERVKGEEWILAKGATVLHLSGIVGDEETNSSLAGDLMRVCGPSRSIKSFISKGYIKNGLRLLNCIHINDICKIVNLFIEETKKGGDGADLIRGQRLLTSCGAFRIQDLVRGLNMDLLEEIIPPHSTMEKSKILSTAKLNALLPEDYEWTLPVPGVDPVSRGLPTAGPLTVEATGTAYDRQWELLKIYFTGKWRGKTAKYLKDKGQECGGKIDHASYIAELKAEKLPRPVSVDEWTLHVYVLDADTVVWHGTGQRMPNGVVDYYTRKNFNNSGRIFCFPALLGICAPSTNSNKFGAESSFFYKGSRSLIVVNYSLDATSGRFLLEYLSVTPSRCLLNGDFPLKPSQDEVRGSTDHFIKSLEGKACCRLWKSHTRALDEEGEMCNYPTETIQLFSNPNQIVQLFDDDIVCSIPPEVPVGGACDLVFGCFHTPNYAQMVHLKYGSNGKIECYIAEKWMQD